MKRKNKEIGLKIIFDNIEYSSEECSKLYVKFFTLLAKINKVKLPENIIPSMFSPNFFEEIKNKNV